MNKYQEALDYFRRWFPANDVKECGAYDNAPYLINSLILGYHLYSHLLQELVDKETPKKVVKRISDDGSFIYYSCPRCNKTVERIRTRTRQYCVICGQNLDWSKE